MTISTSDMYCKYFMNEVRSWLDCGGGWFLRWEFRSLGVFLHGLSFRWWLSPDLCAEPEAEAPAHGGGQHRVGEELPRVDVYWHCECHGFAPCRLSVEITSRRMRRAIVLCA